MEKLNWNMKDLWERCILRSIAHAINVAHDPSSSYENSWDGFNYCVQDLWGSNKVGIISFYNNCCVGAFRDTNSLRYDDNKVIDASEFFKNAPKELIQLAKKVTLQYLLLDVKGDIIPVITTAFWGKNNELYSDDSFDEFLINGGDILENEYDFQTIDFDSELRIWIDSYEFEPNQVKLLLQIYARKTENPNSPIILSKKEIEMIGTDDPEGLKESWISFKEMNIDWEIKPFENGDS
jgi:hypothetical protein